MQHKTFRILSLLCIIIIAILSGIYAYFVIINADIGYRLIFKIFPMITLMGLVFSYISIYKATLYSLGILFNLFLCMIGDIFMGIYDPSVLDISQNQTIYILFGGSFFFVARATLTIVFAIKPYNFVSKIQHKFKILLISHLSFTGPYIIIAILNIYRDPSMISIFTSIYIILGFGIPLSYSFLRIGALNNLEIQESKISSIFAFIGMFLFNTSDILLFISIFTNLIPSYFVLLSDGIYWLSMFLITISIVRSSLESIEKGILILQVDDN